MLEVGIHFENVVGIYVFEDVFKTSCVGLTEAFLFAFKQVNIMVMFLEIFDDFGSVVRRVVIDNKNTHVPFGRLSENFEEPVYQYFNVLFFIVGWYGNAGAFFIVFFRVHE